MNCPRCRAKAKTTLETYNYRECGLDTVTLVGVEVLHCAECGAHSPRLKNVEALHQAIARSVARKTSQLEGLEIRFLRKYLGYSGTHFAKAIGATPETVSRWENGKKPIGESYEKLLRLMVFNSKPFEVYPPDQLLEAPKPSAKKSRVRLEPSDHGWRQAGAAA